MKKTRLLSLEYKPGYSDMMGGYYREWLDQDENGGWRLTTRERDIWRGPETTTVYEVSPEAIAGFEDFLAENEIFSLRYREPDGLFITDYSPWSYQFRYSSGPEDGGKVKHCDLEQCRKYSAEDLKLLNELEERFEALRGKVLSTQVRPEQKEEE